MIAYLDSSALIKQYLQDEPGFDEVYAIAAQTRTIATSRLSFVEVRAGLAAARRADRLGPIEHDLAVTSFGQAWQAYSVLDVSETVCLRAGAIAGIFGLRAGDSIQLASMLELGSEDDVVVVAWDARLRAAAASAGLAVFPSDR